MSMQNCETSAGCDYLIQRDGTYHIVVKSLQITEPLTKITSFTADPLAIRKLFIEGQDVHYFPRGLSKIIPNLAEISIINCNLKSIDASDLRGLEKLKVLNLSQNRMTHLPDDLFTHVPCRCFNKPTSATTKSFLAGRAYSYAAFAQNALSVSPKVSNCTPLLVDIAFM